MYPLDTNVVSELRRPHGAVRSIDDKDLFVSAVTIGEIQAGIEITREQDPEKAHQIEQWLDLVSGTYNIIPVDARAFRVWARLMHRTSDTLYEDAMIAVAATVSNLVVVTRNITDFRLFGVALFNPFDGASYQSRAQTGFSKRS